MWNRKFDSVMLIARCVVFIADHELEFKIIYIADAWPISPIFISKNTTLVSITVNLIFLHFYKLFFIWWWWWFKLRILSGNVCSNKKFKTTGIFKITNSSIDLGIGLKFFAVNLSSPNYKTHAIVIFYPFM